MVKKKKKAKAIITGNRMMMKKFQSKSNPIAIVASTIFKQWQKNKIKIKTNKLYGITIPSYVYTLLRNPGDRFTIDADSIHRTVLFSSHHAESTYFLSSLGSLGFGDFSTTP